MDVGGLVTTFFNNAGPGGVVVLLIFGAACTIFYLLTRWILAGGKGTRLRPYTTDFVLLDRAQNLNPRDWQPLIAANRPSSDEATLPGVHFGPLATGETVVADSAFLARLLAIDARLVMGAE